MNPEAVGTLLGALIGTLITTVVATIAVLPKILKAVGLQAKNTEENERISKEVEDLRGTVNALGDANDKLRTQRTDDSVQIEALKEDQKQKSAIIAQMRAQLDKADDRQRESEKIVAEMQGRLSEQREAADRQQKRLEQLIETNAEERQRASRLEGELKSEQQKNASLILKTDTMQAELDQTKRDLNEERIKRGALEVLVSSLQAEVKHLKDIPVPVSTVVETKIEAAIPPQEKQ